MRTNIFESKAGGIIFAFRRVKRLMIMPEALPNTRPPAAPSVQDPVFIEEDRDELAAYWSTDFWGQLLPLAIVLAIVAATVMMSTPQPEPAPQPVEEQILQREGLSHEQLDSQAIPDFMEILDEVPEDPNG